MAQDYKFITVDGEQVRPQNAYWVIYDPNGEPIKANPSTVAIADNRLAAMRAAFHGDSAALSAALDGHTIELMTFKRFIKDVAPHLPEFK